MQTNYNHILYMQDQVEILLLLSTSNKPATVLSILKYYVTFNSLESLQRQILLLATFTNEELDSKR